MIGSNSPTYSVGRLVASGEKLSLRPGESLTVMAEGGTVQQLMGASIYRDPSTSAERTALSTAGRAAQGPRDAAAIGGTRGATEACLREAKKANRPEDPCWKIASASPYLTIDAMGEEVRADGQTVHIRLRANFTGRAVCVRRQAGLEPSYLPGAEPIRPLRLQQGTPVVWPSRGAPGLVSDPTAGPLLLSCHGVSEQFWPGDTPVLLSAMTPFDVAPLMKGVAQLLGGEARTVTLSLNGVR